MRQTDIGIPGLIALLLAGPAVADATHGLSLDLLLQVEVEGASRFAQPLTEAPASVSVLSAEDIRHFGFRNIGEALQSMRGVYTSYERDYSYIGIRGFARPGDYNTRMLMLTDGLRRNDPLYDTAMVGNEAALEMDWIKRIEFVPGPASALYGANALFGVANAVLWSGADLEGSRITAELGNNGMQRLGFLSGRSIAGGGDWLFGVSSYGRRGENLYFGEFDAPGTSDGIAHRQDGERYLKAIAKLNTGSWNFNATYSSRRKNVPTGYYGTLFDTPGNYLLDQYAYADIGHATALGGDWTQTLRLRAGHYASVGEYVFPGLTNRDDARATWWGAEYLLNWSGAKNHRVMFGLDAQRNHQLDQRNADLTPRLDHLDDRRANGSVGVFIQDEWRIGQRWMTNLGLRSDRIGGFSAVSPRAALIFHPQPETAIKLIHGKAFRPPNTYERYYNDGEIFQKVNADLKPEHIVTDELVFDHAITPAARVAASYFHYRLERLIEQITDVDGLLVFVNRPDIHAHGLELEAELTLPAGMHLKGSMTRQMVRQPFGDPINSPRRLGKLLVDGPLWSSGWTVGLNLQAVDRRRSLTGEVPGYVVGNIVLRGKVPGAGGMWTLGLYNLADHRYFDPASAPVGSGVVLQDGRQVRLGWEVHY